jgi:hypothetical protein
MTYGSTYDNITEPKAKKFECEKSGCSGGFWGIFPDYFYKEPYRDNTNRLPNLETTAQCPECKTVNKVYWYAQKHPS